MAMTAISVRQAYSFHERMTPMSKKTLTPSAELVTARDPQGIKFLDVVAAAYTKNRLLKDEAQRVAEAGGLNDLIDSYIAQHRYEVPPVLKLVASGIKATGAKHFVADKASLKEANIGWTGSNFDQFFLGKVEEDVEDATLAIHRLEKRSVDDPIRKELGQEREEITLAHFFDLLKKQSKGEPGHLLVNGYANIVYIRDKSGTLFAVDAGWGSYCRFWIVGADSVEDPGGWNRGNQVVSRDC